jgi:hypothetical protein
MPISDNSRESLAFGKGRKYLFLALLEVDLKPNLNIL